MNLTARIRRRQRSGPTTRLIVEYDAISPAVHVEEPIGRGPVVERLLDYMESAFDGELPPNAYVWGAPGAGKSAIITALFDRLERLLHRSREAIHTATRTHPDGTPSFVYVDARRSTSEFGLHQTILDSVVVESVPEHGVGIDSIQSWLNEFLTDNRTLVAVDHVGESGTYSVLELASMLEQFDGLSWVAVGQQPPDELERVPSERIEIPAYDDHVLVDVLTERASNGLAQRAVSHEQLRRLVGWADGNAHDAIAALFGAAIDAIEHDRSRISEQNLQTGMAVVPRPSVSLARVLSLADSRQSVLRELVDLAESQRSSVGTTTKAIAASSTIELSEATVKRFLYELAETGVIERVTNDTGERSIGRPPSRIEPRFPTRVFRHVYDLKRE
ncbi:Cdc6/Cdc18 family protein [Halocatena pleomorpha]|uniref:AAA family ATPase n=1 Tax=Halocatena pleomorpha TaxID=1785090 RepID=A0A3P3RGH4_9EURY|nr:AAA family ATPase [Halocatena pleomorpha]RRJ32494.1 AAA family ATPase [Halocatena pleomorpha]